MHAGRRLGGETQAAGSARLAAVGQTGLLATQLCLHASLLASVIFAGQSNRSAQLSMCQIKHPMHDVCAAASEAIGRASWAGLRAQAAAAVYQAGNEETKHVTLYTMHCAWGTPFSMQVEKE